MGLMAKKSDNDFNFEMCPAGNHVAVCFSVIDLGMQEVEYLGQKSFKRKVRISWELPGELMTQGELAGQPFSISKNYTLSLSDKANLFQDLNSWRGRPFSEQELEGFDLYNVLGAPCMLNVVHRPNHDGSRTYANVSSIAQLPKAIQKPQPVNELRKFNTEEFSQADLNALPDWLKDKINFPKPETAQQQDQPPVDIYDDEIPF